jgi:esterase/lipase superfamily enzyme
MTSKINKPITLYVSCNDLVLKASKACHGKPRAEESGDSLLIAKGFETIDGSDVDISFLSHSYFANNESIKTG